MTSAAGAPQRSWSTRSARVTSERAAAQRPDAPRLLPAHQQAHHLALQRIRLVDDGEARVVFRKKQRGLMEQKLSSAFFPAFLQTLFPTGLKPCNQAFGMPLTLNALDNGLTFVGGCFDLLHGNILLQLDSVQHRQVGVVEQGVESGSTGRSQSPARAP